jgi:hypothetical protein
MYVVLRLISLILIILGLMLLGADAVTSLEKGGEIFVRPLEDVLGLVSNIDGFKAWCDYYLPAFLATAMFNLLRVPGWAVTGVVGVVMAFLFGRRPHQ